MKKPIARRAKSPSCGSKTGGSIAQSLHFSKSKHKKGDPPWTTTRARAWLKKHGYRHDGKLDTTPNQWRFRQFAPRTSCAYRAQPLGNSGVQAILELPKKVKRTVAQAVDEEMVLPTRRHRR